jgi:hypothetical protein
MRRSASIQSGSTPTNQLDRFGGGPDMTSDRARPSFDPSRRYTSVVVQQGRVTLESDANEAAMIGAESLRLEMFDVLGPARAIVDGYAVNEKGNIGLSIKPGIFYLGGWRLEIDNPVDLTDQPDWQDAPPLTDLTKHKSAIVALLISEQIVSAVEDQALREVALGGPDTSARSRLMQRFLLLAPPKDVATCDQGMSQIRQMVGDDGAVLDMDTMQIKSSATLQVGFNDASSTVTDPCLGPVAGGYLGADNQTVRVTVVSFASGTGTLLWGWNNASILYRATWAGTNTLKIAPPPVNGERAPQPGQPIEILRVAATLDQHQNFVAQAQGVVAKVAAYSADNAQITLDTPLPNDPNDSRNPYRTDTVLFARIWQGQVDFTSGQEAVLDPASGLKVTVVMMSVPTKIAFRPFWCFALRPNTPALLYPQRFLDGPQPPDGPRQWLTSLAVVQGEGNKWKVVQDCRQLFVPPITPALHVTGMNWKNDDLLSAVQMVEGLQITLDGPVDEQSVNSSMQHYADSSANNSSTMIVAAEFVDSLQRESLNGSLQISNRIILNGSVELTNGGLTILWAPIYDKTHLGALWSPLGLPRIRVTLKGHAISSRGGSLHLDGQTFALPGVGADGVMPRVDLAFPSGNNNRASDFESWFWLTPPPSLIVQPPSWDYGTVTYGDNSDHTFTLTAQASPVTITTPFTPSPNSSFSLVPRQQLGGSIVLKPGSQYTFVVRFSPKDPNSLNYQSKIVITSDATDAAGNPLTISLKGTASVNIT